MTTNIRQTTRFLLFDFLKVGPKIRARSTFSVMCEAVFKISSRHFIFRSTVSRTHSENKHVVEVKIRTFTHIQKEG